MRADKFLAKTKKILLALGGYLVLLLLLQLFNFSAPGSDEEAKYSDYFVNHMKTFGLHLPEKLDFAGEPVPLNDFSIMESLDRELLVNTYWQSQTLLLFKRANRWFPVIEPLLKQNGIPEDFKYIAVVESGLTNLVSPAKATGYWQLIGETAKTYGLRIDQEVDERYSMEKSTQAACLYFKEAYAKLKNWTLVAASYNMGINGIQSQLDFQRVSGYYDLFLNEETSRYIFRILAVKEILSHPATYGFILRKNDLYPPLQTRQLTVNAPIKNLAEFALDNGISYKVLKLLNPWLRGSSLNNEQAETYSISLPRKGLTDFRWDEYSNEENSAQTDSLLLFSKCGHSADSLTSSQSPQ